MPVLSPVLAWYAIPTMHEKEAALLPWLKG
jgi:hypothetical protein